MASSTIRKAIGAVKDQTSIGLAKVAGNAAPDLEILIVKATTHDNEPADDKYIREISNMVSYSQGYVHTCIFAISKRLSKTRDWTVALKTLILVHRLLIDGNPSFGEELMVSSRRGTRILNMSGFRDEAHSSSWDHSAFVKAYALYLDQRLEFLVYERKLGIITGNDKNQKSDMFGELKHKSGYESNKDERARSFEELTMAEVRRQINDLGPERVMGRLNQLIFLLERLLAARPAGAAQNTRMVLIALHLLVIDSFKLYGDISDMLRSLVEHFSELDYSCCVKAFDAYVNAAQAIDELVRFYSWCKGVGIARSSEFPEVEKISNGLLGMLERLLREKGNKPKQGSESREEITSEEVVEEKEQSMLDIKALPPPESIQQPQDEPLNPTNDLVNLRDDDGVSADEQSNKLALSLFSSTDELTNVASAWDHPGAEPGKPNWELALINSASQLSNQKADLGGGFNPLVLNGMYDQEAITQYMNNSQLRSGSASSVAAGKTTTGQTLALPALDGTMLQDPFAASLSVPPPAYVQIADMERKQQLLTQEKQLWQQYANRGMQGHISTSYPTSAQFAPPPHRIP